MTTSGCKNYEYVFKGTKYVLNKEVIHEMGSETIDLLFETDTAKIYKLEPIKNTETENFNQYPISGINVLTDNEIKKLFSIVLDVKNFSKDTKTCLFTPSYGISFQTVKNVIVDLIISEDCNQIKVLKSEKPLIIDYDKNQGSLNMFLNNMVFLSSQKARVVNEIGFKEPINIDPQVETMLGEELLNVLLNPDIIKSYLVKPMKTRDTLNSVESYQIIKKGKNLTVEEIKSLQEIISDESSYDFEDDKLCMFAPNMAFKCIKGTEIVNLLVSLDCMQVSFFYKEKKILEDIKTPKMEELIKQKFPTDF